MTEADTDSTFEGLRPRLFGIAYRMTGSVADAEDAVQDAWLRWLDTDHDLVRSAEAYLVTTVTRLAIDRLRSAERRRATYVGPYLPEPIVEGPLTDPLVATPFDDPAESAELADSLTFAFLLLLDELDPTERAVFLLHDVFGYSFEEVAAAVGASPAACRQRASRARRRIDAERVDLRHLEGERERAVLQAMVGAMSSGDIPALMALLSPDVVQFDDGGPARRAARRPIVGPHRVARLMVTLAQRIPPGASAELVRVNHCPGLLLRQDGRPDLVMMVEFAPDGLVRRLWAQLNPEKLAHLG